MAKLSFQKLRGVAARAGVLGLLTACGAVYPELSTPIRALPPQRALTPPPPDDLLFIKFAFAVIPTRTRDGRSWDSVGGSLPDPLAKLIIDDKDILVTPVQSNTLRPTWPNQRKANYRIPAGAIARVELWDSNPLTNHPICVTQLRDLRGEAQGEGFTELNCESGAQIAFVIDPAHARLGLGLFYELRREDVFVTRVLSESPASRARIAVGDQLLKIQGQDVKTMKNGEAQSLINANAPSGVTLSIRKRDGAVVESQLKEGPIYPTVDEDIGIDG